MTESRSEIACGWDEGDYLPRGKKELRGGTGVSCVLTVVRTSRLYTCAISLPVITLSSSISFSSLFFLLNFLESVLKK